MTAPDHDRVFVLFTELCDLPRGERTRALDAACGDDRELRSAVEALLRADTDAGDVLSDDAIEAQRRLHDGAPPEPASGSVGGSETIGSFTLVRLIGRGGMGEVYEATQASPQRRVAVKVIRPGAASASALARFRREAEVLGLLQHPGIAQIYESGEHEGRPYIAMEYIEGADLKSYVERQDLSIDDRLELIARVADAIHHAHQKGVVHRDLKPENILVPATDGTAGGTSGKSAGGTGTRVDQAGPGQPKVLDFGIARAADGLVAVTGGQTIAGQLVGTLAYMSPEQLEGDPDIDVRADVFAIGMIAFELLAGSLPTRDGHSSVAALLRDRAERPHERLGTRSPRFRGDIETIVAKATETDRERRYASAAELAADIRRHLSSQPIGARPPSLVYQFSRFTRRNRGLVAGIALSVLALVAGLVGMSLFAVRSQALLRRSEAMLYTASVEAASQALHRGNNQLATEHLSRAPAPLRGWEWRHLRARGDHVVRGATHGDRFRLQLQSGVVWSGAGDSFWFNAVLADGTRGVVSMDAETLEVTGEVPFALYEGAWEKTTVAFDASGTRLVHLEEESGAFQGRVIGLPDGGELERFLLGPPAETASGVVPLVRKGGCVLVFTGDRWRCVNAGALMTHPSLGEIGVVRSEDPDDSSVLVFGLEDGRVLRRFPVLGGDTRPPVFAGESVVHLGDHGAVDVFDIDSGEPRAWSPVRLHPLQPNIAMPSPEGRLVYLGTTRGVVTSVDVETGEIGASRRGPASDSIVLALGMRPEGSEIISIDQAGDVQVWEASRRETSVMRGHEHWVDAVALSPDGALLATGDWAGSIRLWDTRTRRQIWDTRVPNSGGAYTVVEELDFSPDGGRLALVRSGGWTGAHRVEERDAATGEKIRDLALIGNQPAWVRYHPDGRVFVSSVEEAVGPVAEGVVGISRAFGPVDFSPADPSLSAVLVPRRPAEFLVRVFDNRTTETIYEVPLDGRRYRIVAYSPDGRRIAVVNAGVVKLLDASDGRLLGELRGHADEVFDVAWSPEGSRLVTASRDRTVGVWDAGALRMITPLFGHTDFVDDVVWSPDGETVFSTSHDGTVRAWDAR